ncbi:hypothetical protein [Lacticaseibacillus mingshuiensis]|uniref:DUF1129 family protein n=1 Tax=Lacticaseibacillus mingshuiensis TaxID=2799574 RepID=A0ABW4CDR9_9LACO|nr:hypothetical protein [Lacticaseibacillus mingshuiensis]
MSRELTKAMQEKMAGIHGIDHVYADTLVRYLLSFPSKDPRAVEETAEAILDDMTDAQQAGQRLPDNFGQDPQTAADEIVAALPNRSGAQWLDYLWPLFNMSLVGATLDAFWRRPPAWHLADLTTFALFLLIWVIGAVVRGGGFNKLKRKTTLRLGVWLILYFAGFVGLAAVVTRLDHQVIGAGALLIFWGVMTAVSLVASLWRRSLRFNWPILWGLMTVTAAVGPQLSTGWWVALLAVNVAWLVWTAITATDN